MSNTLSNTLADLLKNVVSAQAEANKANKNRNGIANLILGELQRVGSTGMKEALVAAYMEAGWGMKGVIRGNPAPKTVQTYASVIRKAVVAGVDPQLHETWSQFRKATKGAPAPKWYNQGEEFISSLPKEERAAMAARFADMISIEIMEATMKA